MANRCTAIYLGVFLLDDELSASPPDQPAARRAIADAVPGMTLPDGCAAGEVLLTPDRPAGTATSSPFLLDVEVVTPEATIGVLIGHTGVAALTIAQDIDLDDVDAADRSTAERCASLRSQVALSSGALRASGQAHSRSSTAIGGGHFLWWHRLLISDGDAFRLHANLAFGVPIESASGQVGLVSQGFSVIPSAHAALAGEVIRGLFAATEEWIEVDQVDRQIASWIPSTRGNDDDLERTQRDVREAAARLLAHRAMFGERARYLRNGARAALVAARRAWMIDEQLTQMDDSVGEARRIVGEAADEREARRDRQRNDYLFAFTLLAVLQTVLAVFDFVTNGNQIIVGGARIFVAGVVVGAGLLVITRAAWRSHEKAEGLEQVDNTAG